MTKQTISTVLFSAAMAFGLAVSAHADSLYASASTSEYQSPDSYDFSDSNNLPPTTYQKIGTFSFTPIAASAVTSITISGTFGNQDYGSTTALSDYYLGDGTDGETAVTVATCDSAAADCYSGQEGPYAWTLTLNGAQIADLGNGLAAGAIDFGYKWNPNTPAIPDPFFGDSNGDDLQYVNAGPATLAVFTPEPCTVLFCFSGIAGLVALRRFRKI